MFKGVFKKLALAAIVALLIAPAVAGAQVYYSVRELLSTQFAHSERVSYLKVHPEGPDRARVEARLGRALPKQDFTFYVATSGGRVDGYALFDQERGQHELIDFATFFDARGQITRVEVLQYREPYGDGIRAARFKRQFVGRSGHSGFAPDRDIDAVAGATISSRSMCAGVQRASVLLEETVLRAKPVVATSR